MGADSTGFTNHWTAATYAKATYTVYGAIQNTDSLGASSVLLMNGRRYKVAAAQQGLTAGQGLALTETFAGSSYMELCADCVKAMAATGTDESGNTIDVNGNYGYGFDLKQGDQVMIGGATNFDNLLTVAVDTTGIFDDKIAARKAALFFLYPGARRPAGRLQGNRWEVPGRAPVLPPALPRRRRQEEARRLHHAHKHLSVRQARQQTLPEADVLPAHLRGHAEHLQTLRSVQSAEGCGAARRGGRVQQSRTAVRPGHIQGVPARSASLEGR